MEAVSFYVYSLFHNLKSQKGFLIQCFVHWSGKWSRYSQVASFPGLPFSRTTREEEKKKKKNKRVEGLVQLIT